MPTPVSRIVSSTSPSTQLTASSTLPPAGIASRALSARFVITCSTWPRSARTRQSGRDGRRELDIVAQEPREQPLEPGDDVAEIQDLRLEHLMAAEGEQLARERSGTIGGAHDLQCVRAPRIVVVEAGDEELAVTADRGQQIVEVVGDAAGEPSNRLELLRMQQLLLQQALIGHVSVVDDDDPVAVLPAPATDRLDRAPGSVLVAKPDLDRHRFLAREHRSERLPYRLVVVGVQQRKALRAEDLLGGIAEHALDRRALVEARAVGGEHRDRVGGVLDQRAEQLFAGAQRLLCGQLLGDVAEAPHAADDLAAQPLRRRVALDRPAVDQLEDVVRHALTGPRRSPSPGARTRPARRGCPGRCRAPRRRRRCRARTAGSARARRTGGCTC